MINHNNDKTMELKKTSSVELRFRTCRINASNVE